MSKQIHALLVGINKYNHSRIADLKGCKNDVKNIKNYLESRFEKPNILTLTDEEASYQNIIDKFRSHLTANAKKDDIVLFQYSGHGSREVAAAEFKPFFPEGKEETLVCYDSRKVDGYDLADKELAVLVTEVAETGAHVVVLLDCCHSGSGTREVDDFLLGATRRTYSRREERPLETYIGGYYKRELEETGKVVIPSEKHILLAACDRTESARETKLNTGLFTSTLLNTLKKMGSDISYADLFLKCRIEIINESVDQTPQFESYHLFNAHSRFLDGRDMDDLKEKEIHYNDTNGEWVMYYGALDGLEITPDCVPVFEIFSGADPSVSLGYADVKEVFPERSHLKLDFRPRTISNLYAKPISLPAPKMAVHLHGDEESVKKFKAKETQFVNILFTDTLKGTKYNVKVEEEGIYVYFNHTNELIYGHENYLFDNNVKYTIDILEIILRWENGLTLQNRNTKLSEDSIDFVLTDANDQPILTESQIAASNGKALKPTPNEDFFTLYTDEKVDNGKVKIFLKAQHRCNQKLHFALVYFSEEFGIEVYRNESVDTNQGMITLFGDGKDDIIWLENEEEYHDVFKLIVSTERISDFLIQQEGIKLGTIKRDPRRSGRTHGYRLLANDWFTKTVHIRLVKRKNEVNETATQLGDKNQLVIGGHPSFKAKLSLSAAQTNSRNIDSFSTAAEVFSQQEGELLSFGATHGNNSNVLVLNDIAADEDLKNQPLEIDVNVPTSEEELIWSFTYDDGVIVPIGEAIAAKDGGSTKIVIKEIPDIKYPDIYNPDNPEPGKRSLTKALKLVFFKFIKLKGKTHQLRYVDYTEADSIKRIKGGLKEEVQKAQNILLLVHGIIGDTQQMAEAFRPAIEGDAKKYDLVLTYDYENLNTPIEETADLLYTKLVHDLNLLQSNKNLDIVAHSMGGLVSRYMIEKLKGDEFVRHLFMCGTPNAGSPIADVLDYRNVVIAILTAGINLGFSTPIAAGALGVLNKTKLLTVTLEQMNPEGEFIAKLKKTLQPKTQYTIIAGDLKAYREKSDDYTQGVFNKVLNKVSGFFHEDELNDIAVSMDSIKGVNHFNQPPPKKLEVACHHMNYFTDEGGFAVVREEIGC